MNKAEKEDLRYSAKLKCTDDGTRELLYEEIDNLMLTAEGEWECMKKEGFYTIAMRIEKMFIKEKISLNETPKSFISDLGLYALFHGGSFFWGLK